MPKAKAKMTFADAVRAVVRKIPKGKTLSYKEVATRAGNPKAARAVALVMAKNFDPTVPCHRVIRNDGTLGGYNRGGITAKRRILQGEGAVI
jgi:methylated-DNA-[protein]-cysteine S-methyltransferase